MATETRTTGFYANDIEVFYVAPSGRAWIVASPDFDGIQGLSAADIPDDAVECDGLLTPEEAIDYCRQVEEESGEKLIETAD